MKLQGHTLGRRCQRFGAASLATMLMVFLGGALVTVGSGALPTASASVQSAVDLGTATSFAVLGGQAVTNTGPSVINGDLGVSPGTAITGFPPGVLNGAEHSADAVALQAQSDVTIAYNDAARRTPDATGVSVLTGRTLAPGVYNSAGSMSLDGTLTLDGQGRSDSVFIFQAGSTLITEPNSTVALINGAQACNVFWQVGSSATLKTNTTFVGNILALTSISLQTGSTVQGRVLARNGSTTLDTNLITKSTCAAAPPTTAPTQPAPSTTAPTQPAPSTTAPTQPAPSTTAPTQPAPSTTAPTQPAPSTTAPTQPAPSTTAPTQPAPSTTAPTQPAPSTTAPTQPAPSTTAPTQPAPSTTAPTQPAPSTTAPTQPAPSTTAPTQPAPSTTAPTQPAPSTTAPTQPAPSTTAPTQPAPSTTAPVRLPSANTPQGGPGTQQVTNVPKGGADTGDGGSMSGGFDTTLGAMGGLSLLVSGLALIWWRRDTAKR